VPKLPTIWHDRGQYANLIKDVMQTQIKSFQKERDNLKKTKIAQSIGYLGQIINSLITSQEETGFKPEMPKVEEDITEETVKEIVRSQVLEKGKKENSCWKNEILHYIIKFKKCDINYANLVFRKFEELGVDSCKKGVAYYIPKFAKMRGYVTEKEFEEWEKELEIHNERRY